MMTFVHKRYGFKLRCAQISFNYFGSIVELSES